MEEYEMLSLTKKLIVPVVVVATMTTFASSASAMPFADALAIKNAVPAQVETVQWRRGWGWRGAGLGFVAGAVIGSALAAPYYGGYGYGGCGYYGCGGRGYYAQSYYAAPTYYAPTYYAAPAYYGGYYGGGYYGGWGGRRGWYGRW
jgi:hypothetical protein